MQDARHDVIIDEENTRNLEEKAAIVVKAQCKLRVNISGTKQPLMS